MIAETVALPVQVPFAAKVIQSSFTNTDNFSIPGKRGKFFDSRIITFPNVGVNPSRNRDHSIALDQVPHRRICLQVDADTHHVLKTVTGRMIHESGKIAVIGVEVKAIEVTMGIY